MTVSGVDSINRVNVITHSCTSDALRPVTSGCCSRVSPSIISNRNAVLNSPLYLSLLSRSRVVCIMTSAWTQYPVAGNSARVFMEAAPSPEAEVREANERVRSSAASLYRELSNNPDEAFKSHRIAATRDTLAQIERHLKDVNMALGQSCADLANDLQFMSRRNASLQQVKELSQVLRRITSFGRPYHGDSEVRRLCQVLDDITRDVHIDVRPDVTVNARTVVNFQGGSHSTVNIRQTNQIVEEPAVRVTTLHRGRLVGQADYKPAEPQPPY